MQCERVAAIVRDDAIVFSIGVRSAIRDVYKRQAEQSRNDKAAGQRDMGLFW